MRSFRSRAERSLTRWPALYAALLRRRPGHDFDRWLFLRLVRRGDTVFDVGANLGVYSLLFSRLVGRSGQVHAFEPGPPTFAGLERHLEREGPCRNLRANHLAVGAAAGTATLYLPGDDHGQASLSRQTEGSWTTAPAVAEFAVPMTTLDAYAAARTPSPVHLVKIDVEGPSWGCSREAPACWHATTRSSTWRSPTVGRAPSATGRPRWWRSSPGWATRPSTGCKGTRGSSAIRRRSWRT